MTETTYYGGTDAPLSPNQLKGGDPNVTGVERWISILGGGTLATWGAKRGGAVGTLAAIAGTALIARGAVGQDPVKRSFQPTPYERQVAQDRGWSTAASAGSKVTINKPRQEIYAYCREVGNLATFMENIESIDVLDDRRSRWTIKAPAGQTISYTSTLAEDVPGERLAWTAEGPDADVRNAGWLEFKDGPAGRGTEVGLTALYEPPFGQFGRVAAKFTRKEPGIQARTDLKRLKMLMETGEVSTGKRQAAGPGQK